MIEINESDPRQPKLQQYFNLHGNFLYYIIIVHVKIHIT